MKGMLRINRWDFNLFIFRQNLESFFPGFVLSSHLYLAGKRSGLPDAGRIKLARKGLRAEFSPLGGEWRGRKRKEKK